MKKNWEVKKLGEILKLEYGKPLPDEKRVIDGSFPVYGANGLKGRSNIFYYDKKTIIVGRKGSAGEINLTEEKFWPLDVTYFITFDERKYDLLFLFHLLSLLNLPKLAKGVKPGINRNEVYNLEASVPPLPEQRRIVSVLDKCFTAINKVKTNTEQNLKNTKELFNCYLQGVFESGKDWEVKKLGECFKLKSGDMLSSKMMKIGEIPVYGGNGISGYHNTFNLQGENVIIGRVGALCGNVRSINENIWLTDNAFLVTDYKYNFNKPFLTYLLNYKNLRNYARQAAQPVISNSSLNNVELSFPNSKSEQQSIVRQLDSLKIQTQKLETVYNKKISDLDELKKSILQEAFRGRLTAEAYK